MGARSSAPGRPSGPPALEHPAPGPWRRRLRSWRRWALIVICAVLLAVAIRAEESMVARSLRSFGHLHLRPLPVRRSIAIAYASNAMSASLPMVGSGAASSFTYKRLVAQGATPALAGWAMILSGVTSNAVFVVIICIGAIFSGSVIGDAASAAGIVLTILVVWLTALAMRRPAIQERLIRASVWTLTRVQRTIRRPAGDPARLVANSVSGLGSFAPHRPDVLRTVYYALRNWSFDLLCLAFSIKAAGVRVPWWGIVLVWTAGAGGSSISLTPGGLGVVETALTGALIYRGITFWLAVIIGWIVYLFLRGVPRSSHRRA